MIKLLFPTDSPGLFKVFFLKPLDILMLTEQFNYA